MSFLDRMTAKLRVPDAADTLPGRDHELPGIPDRHAVLGTPIRPPFPPGIRTAVFGLGCFWGAERLFWQTPGVYSTAVGYAGGTTPNPTYEETCTGRTGHAENVLVVFDPAKVSTYDLLKVFWENHDPTQGYRQGNDVGTQYRSALYVTTPEQAELAQRTKEAYEKVLVGRGFDPITTEILSAEGLPFYYAEAYHQQYLYKIPHGYDCHAETGIALPPL
jgi:peptide-methionine (S)-S-oxide reductase